MSQIIRGRDSLALYEILSVVRYPVVRRRDNGLCKVLHSFTTTAPEGSPPPPPPPFSQLEELISCFAPIKPFAFSNFWASRAIHTVSRFMDFDVASALALALGLAL